MQTDFSHVFGGKSVFSWRKGYKIAETLGVFGFYAYLCHRKRKKGKYQSGQMGQTVNLLAYAFGGSNPSLPTLPTQRQPVVASVFLCMIGLFRAERRERWPRSGGGLAQRVRRAKAWSEGIIDRLHNIHVPLYDIQVLCGERQSTGEVSSADSRILGLMVKCTPERGQKCSLFHLMVKCTPIIVELPSVYRGCKPLICFQ